MNKQTNLPDIKNNSKSDTLLLAFKYILDFYYGNVSFETIQTILAHDKKQTNVDDLRYGSKDFGLQFEEIELSSDMVHSHLFPCIVIAENDDVGIVTSFEEGIATLLDPLTQHQEHVGIEVLQERFCTLLSFYKDVSYKNILTHETKDKEWFWKHLLDAKADIIRVGVLTVFINLFIILIPMYAMNVYNRVIPNFATETLFVLTIGIAFIFIFDAIFKMARVYILESMGKRIGSILEEEMLKRILLIQSGHDHLLAGSKANLFREIAQIRDFFMSKSIGLALDLPFVFLTLLVIFIISPAIAAVTFACGFIIVGINLAFQITIFSWSKKLFKDGQMKHNYLFETIKGIETLKLTNAITRRLFKWRQLVNFYNFINLKIQMHSNIAMNLSAVVMQMATVLTLVVGVYEIQDKNMTIGALVALGILVGRAMVPIVNISTILSKYKEFKESLESINNFWHLPLETQKSIEIGIQTLQGDIEFNNVTYTYSGSKAPSLMGATFKIKAGEKVGFIGRTGAGKSTVLRLLSGLDTAQSGTIHIDGHEINTIHPVELRANIGIMPQEPFLFAGTLKENIEIGVNIGKERLIKLLAMTGLEELVKRSGEGENFQVGENGNRLSVGQRHLVGLARALINDPAIIVLDEPTTGMDVGLEKEMVEHLKPMVKDKTLIVITHRFAALELVDRVLVVNNGRIVADGARDEILRQLQGKQP
ncbi:ATP-binding cassette domain-containing protein [Sulfurospirillum arsenophilum]|uniref:ATP-binding cassette domain-containing protein n=1 Tax=Sulfurospirillum arsenophilum TaxID=56698 RepID=UPI0005A818AB|nr:ATP-binding cassette domain-containing protein [Sulfurospirillum arsenophilum]